MTEDRKQLGVRVRKEVVDALDRVNEKQAVGSRSETLEWLILRGCRHIEDREHVRELWVWLLQKDYAPNAPVAVRITEGERNSRGERTYAATATIDGAESHLLEAEAFDTDSGGLEVTISMPENENSPALVFERLTAVQAAEIREGTGWQGSDNLQYSLCRPLSDTRSLPIWDAPGDRTPETRAEVEE
jgi:hypothetical protein